MKIALFGGTFDPVHNGHLRVARAAAAQFSLDRVLFVPSGNPPHKPRAPLTPFVHRFAMVALACAREPRFVPSAIESPSDSPRFSVDTVRRVRRTLSAGDHLYFLLGLDAFVDIPHWKQPSRLLDLVDFIVVSRPGFKWSAIAATIPPRLLRERKSKLQPSQDATVLELRRTRIHLLRGVHAAISSRAIRRRLRSGGSATGLIPPLVEKYIVKEGIYGPMRKTIC